MVTKTLELIFQTASGGRSTIRVSDPKDTLTAADVQAAMNQIISLNVFHVNGASLIGVIGARVVVRDVQELAVS